jgi:hypothetical protein
VEALAHLVHFLGPGAHNASNGARKHMLVHEGGLRMMVRRGFSTGWIVHDESDQVLSCDVWDRTLENQFYRLKLVRVSSRRSSQRQAKHGAEQCDCREGRQMFRANWSAALTSAFSAQIPGCRNIPQIPEVHALGPLGPLKFSIARLYELLMRTNS